MSEHKLIYSEKDINTNKRVHFHPPHPSTLPHQGCQLNMLLRQMFCRRLGLRHGLHFLIYFFADIRIIGEKKKHLIELEDYLGKRKKSIGYMDKTLLRFRNQGLSIKQFTLLR